MPRSFVTKYLDKYIVDDGGCGLFKIVLQFQYYSNIITSYKQLVAVDFASWKKTMRRNRRNSRTLHSGGTDTPVCVMTVSDIFLTCYNDKDFFFLILLFWQIPDQPCRDAKTIHSTATLIRGKSKLLVLENPDNVKIYKVRNWTSG